jgi:hypothetical protein
VVLQNVLASSEELNYLAYFYVKISLYDIDLVGHLGQGDIPISKLSVT